MTDWLVRRLAAKLCDESERHRGMDLEPKFYKRGKPQRFAVGCESRDQYVRQAQEILTR